LVGIPRAWVSGAVIEKVEFWVVAVPPPSGAAAFLPFLAFPSRNSQIFSLMRRVGGREIFSDQHLSIWPGAVGAPDLFARINVVRSDKTAHAKLTAANARDDFIFDHHCGRPDCLPLFGITLLDFPHFYARLGVQRHRVGVKLVKKNLPIGVGGSAIHHITTRDGDGRWILLRLVLPFHWGSRLC